MKNLIFTVLFLLGAIVPVDMRAELIKNTPSVLFWLDFNVGNSDDNDGCVLPFSQYDNIIVSGKIYTDGQMELTFDNNEAVIVSINLNDSEVNSVEFVPTEGDKSLTFDLDDFGKGMYEVNVVMSDGTVQTATFEY